MSRHLPFQLTAEASSHCDVYSLDSCDSPRPCVILVSGAAPGFFIKGCKARGFLPSCAEWLVMNGFTSVVYRRKSGSHGWKAERFEEALTDLIHFVHDSASCLGIDPGRILIWADSSASAYRGISRIFRDPPPFVRGIVASSGQPADAVSPFSPTPSAAPS